MARQKNSAPTLDEFARILRRHGMKATKQRIAVHRAMLALGHASADMVAAEIRKGGIAGITTASVYNILSQMALLGIYARRMSCCSKMFFDVNSFMHIHLYDSENNEYRDVVDDEIMAYIEEKLGRRKFRGYKVEGIDIQIVCRPSRYRRAAANSEHHLSV